MRKRKYKKLSKPLKKFFKKELDGTYSKQESKPERECRLMLDAMGFDYEQEFNIKYKKYSKVYDFFVFSQDKEIAFAIEIQSAWHGEKDLPEYKKITKGKSKAPSKKSKMGKIIKKNIKNDKIKAAILRELKIPLIIIWQYEIDFFPKRVIKRIKDEWKKQEKLSTDRKNQEDKAL